MHVAHCGPAARALDRGLASGHGSGGFDAPSRWRSWELGENRPRFAAFIQMVGTMSASPTMPPGGGRPGISPGERAARRPPAKPLKCGSSGTGSSCSLPRGGRAEGPRGSCAGRPRAQLFQERVSNAVYGHRRFSAQTDDWQPQHRACSMHSHDSQALSTEL